MKLKILLFLLFFTFSFQITAQQNITGKVTDVVTGEGLYATVVSVDIGEFSTTSITPKHQLSTSNKS